MTLYEYMHFSKKKEDTKSKEEKEEIDEELEKQIKKEKRRKAIRDILIGGAIGTGGALLAPLAKKGIVALHEKSKQPKGEYGKDYI